MQESKMLTRSDVLAHQCVCWHRQLVKVWLPPARLVPGDLQNEMVARAPSNYGGAYIRRHLDTVQGPFGEVCSNRVDLDPQERSMLHIRLKIVYVELAELTLHGLQAQRGEDFAHSVLLVGGPTDARS